MTDEERNHIEDLRSQGIGYKKISEMLGLSVNTVKSFCKRNRLGCSEVRQDQHICPWCGKPVEQNAHRKQKKFCSDRCRMQWWNSHLDQVNRKANYSFVCPVCRKAFTAYGNSNRKYCSLDCYFEDRFGGKRS